MRRVSPAALALISACFSAPDPDDDPAAGGGGTTPPVTTTPDVSTPDDPTVHQCRVETDWYEVGPDAPDDGFDRRTFDAAGRLVVDEHVTLQGEGSDYADYYTWDDHDQLLTASYDEGNDGTIDLRSHWVNFYDDLGRLTGKDYYWRADPEPYSVTRYTLDSDGRPVVESFDDFRVDGVYDVITTRAWHADGWLETLIQTSEGSVETQSYDADGLLIRTTYDTDGDGDLDSIVASSFDEAGNLALVSRDDDADGVDDRADRFTNTYDDAGNLVQLDWDGGDDGVVDYVRGFTWSLEGALVAETFDGLPPDGIADARYAYLVEHVPCE